jgi:SET domain-containing protein
MSVSRHEHVLSSLREYVPPFSPYNLFLDTSAFGGTGLFTNDDIADASWVNEYKGEKISWEEAEKREKSFSSDVRCYMYWCQSQTTKFW